MASRMDLFLDMIGGEDALPPKLPPPSPDVDQAPPDSSKSLWWTEYESEEYKNLPHADDVPPDVVQRNSLPSMPTFSVGTPSRALSVDVKVPFDVKKGERLSAGTSLSPFLAVAKYCYRFVPKQWLQPLATAFFDHDKIYERDWDLYYITTHSHGLHTFVPVDQFQTLIDEINTRFEGANIAIDDWQRANGFVLDFTDLPKNLQPRYLGRCTSRSTYSSWVAQLQCEPNMVLSTIPAGDRSAEAFKARLDAATAMTKAKQKANRAKKHAEILARRQDIARQAIRGQQYFGLRPTNDTESTAAGEAKPIATNTPAPYAFEREPVFIAIDCEAFERPPHMITEVGLATLDTRDLKGTAPGENGKNWHQYIRGRHIRILEWKDYKNSDFVQGCPGAYEFGNSEFVSKNSVAGVLAASFQEPFSGPIKPNDYPPLPSSRPTSAFRPINSVGSTSTGELRNIIVVGHDLAGDVKYCEQLGFHIFDGRNIIDTLDTVDLFKQYMREPNPRSLGSILAHFDLAGWFLHNAGNDAMYTMQGLLAMCVKAASENGTEAEAQKVQENLEKRFEESMEIAKERAQGDADGWNLVDQDVDVAKKPSPWDFEPKPRDPKGRDRHGGGGLFTMGGAPLDV
ncbi:putative nucleolar protein C2C4.08 [Cercospora zeina]